MRVDVARPVCAAFLKRRYLFEPSRQFRGAEKKASEKAMYWPGSSGFQRASAALDIHPSHVFAVDMLKGVSFEQGWKDQTRLIVWPPNEQQQ